MKKIFLLLSAALVLGTTFSSCNKKLKDELDELSSEVDALETQNTNLQNQTTDLQNQNTNLQNQTTDLANQNTNLTNQVNVLNEGIGANAPVNFSFSGTLAGGQTLTGAGPYIFKPEDYNSYMEKYSETEVYVEIGRYRESDQEGEYLWFEFDYNPVTKEVTDIRIYNEGIYSSGSLPGQFDFDYDSDFANNTITVNVTKFDFSTGTIAFNVSASSTAGYTRHNFNTYDGNVAPSGEIVSSTFTGSFDGKVGYYDYPETNVIFARKAK